MGKFRVLFVDIVGNFLSLQCTVFAMASVAVRRFRPLADRILVQKLKADVKTASGLLLPDAAKQEVNQGTVIAVGPGRRNTTGDLLPMGTTVGDTVVVPQYGGTLMKFDDGEDYHVYRDEDIVGVIKSE